MRILTLCDQTINHGEGNGLSMTQLLLDCLPDVEHHLIVLTRKQEPNFIEEENGITVWGTGAFACSFAAWDFALARLGNAINSFDYVIFSVANFLPSLSEFKKVFTYEYLQAHIGQSVALGIETASSKPLSLGGHIIKTWLGSNFLVLPSDLVEKLGTMSGASDIENLFIRQRDIHPFATLAVNGAYRDYIDIFFERFVFFWKDKYLINDDVFKLLQSKFVALVHEHLLSVRIKGLEYKLENINLLHQKQSLIKQACAPIAYICFNRPQTVGVTLRALSKATLAENSDLHIFIDAPRNEKDIPGVEAVLSLCNDETITKCFSSVTLHRQTQNIGACEANRQAVQTMCGVSDNFIMLEDDVLFSPHTLQYFNSALQKYKNMPSVFSISSARPPAMVVPEGYPWDAYFYPRIGIWGWASWADRMKLVDWTAADICEFEQSPMLIESFNRGGSDMAPMLSSTVRAPQLGWDIVMDFSRFKHGGVCLTPCQSYTLNIGINMSGMGSVSCNLDGQDNSMAVEEPKLPEFVVVDPQIELATRDGIRALWCGNPETVWK